MDGQCGICLVSVPLPLPLREVADVARFITRCIYLLGRGLLFTFLQRCACTWHRSRNVDKAHAKYRVDNTYLPA